MFTELYKMTTVNTIQVKLILWRVNRQFAVSKSI